MKKLFFFSKNVKPSIYVQQYKTLKYGVRMRRKGMAGERLAGTSTMNHSGLPRFTVSFMRPPSSSSRRVSADSLEVVAMRRPYARCDMKRRATSSASVCMVTGMMILRYMLPS